MIEAVVLQNQDDHVLYRRGGSGYCNRYAGSRAAIGPGCGGCVGLRRGGRNGSGAHRGKIAQVRNAYFGRTGGGPRKRGALPQKNGSRLGRKLDRRGRIDGLRNRSAISTASRTSSTGAPYQATDRGNHTEQQAENLLAHCHGLLIADYLEPGS